MYHIKFKFDKITSFFIKTNLVLIILLILTLIYKLL